MSTTIHHPATDHDTRPAARSARTNAGAAGWAAAGLAAGIGAFVVYGVVSMGLSVPTDAIDDNVELAAELRGTAGWVWAHQVGTFALAVLTSLFGIGLRRRLAAQTPAGSLLPDAAALGMLLVAALTLVGGGISTEMFHTLRHVEETDPDTIATHLTIFNTFGWVWAGGVLTAGAVALAGLRHGAVSRRLAVFAAVMCGLALFTQLVPLQYLVVAPVAIFLIVTGIAMEREARSERGDDLVRL